MTLWMEVLWGIFFLFLKSLVLHLLSSVKNVIRVTLHAIRQDKYKNGCSVYFSINEWLTLLKCLL